MMLVRLAIVLAMVLCVPGCDAGDPSLEEHLSELGLEEESLVTVNEHTLVTVYVRDGTTELLVFRPHSFGGWELTRDVASCPAPGGGVQDAGFSDGAEIDGQQHPAYNYYFGTMPSLNGIRTDGTEARWEIVDPSVGSWVIFVPEQRAERLTWVLLGRGDEELDAGRGTAVAFEFCPER
jgi:hypothetical protein